MKLLSGTKKKQRQANVLNRLENQLKSGVKPWKIFDAEIFPNGDIIQIQTLLTEQDINRINKEIAILKQRIV